MTDWENLKPHHLPSTLGALAINLDRADTEVAELTDQLDLHLGDPDYINKLNMALLHYTQLLDEWRAALKHFQETSQ